MSTSNETILLADMVTYPDPSPSFYSDEPVLDNPVFWITGLLVIISIVAAITILFKVRKHV